LLSASSSSSTWSSSSAAPTRPAAAGAKEDRCLRFWLRKVFHLGWMYRFETLPLFNFFSHPFVSVRSAPPACTPGASATDTAAFEFQIENLQFGISKEIRCTPLFVRFFRVCHFCLDLHWPCPR
jgi:hypothetical protein